ncbi:GPI2-domain-containing protein [Xylona heveae TC161]|uniref:GPI2-domain-containing protein n=1 Tax=Xylona heveae (strain CBS 132557 / TC161) TaxID=1328760 RepID=A0A165AGT2_XYLHT|nr:GPI2-domain-containing protein [Xylona heveae TC161]KZF20447.1 GPI2-domain-containing protein [Xylona heveae TC161]
MPAFHDAAPSAQGDDVSSHQHRNLSVPSPPLAPAPSPPSSQPALLHRTTSSDPNRLAPEDAFFAHSPPRRRQQQQQLVDATQAPKQLVSQGLSNGSSSTSAAAAAALVASRVRAKERGRSGSRRRKGAWKKLLWVKQSYPDNYTDEDTFLDHLQRNPRLQPYEFWPLFADSTVIVQHVCSVIIFACCFTGILQERVSPLTVVTWGSLGTIVGWVLWDRWIYQEEAARVAKEPGLDNEAEEAVSSLSNSASASSSTSLPISGAAPATTATAPPQPLGLGLTIPGASSGILAPSANGSSHHTSSSSSFSPVTTGHPTGAPTFPNYSRFPPPGVTESSAFSPRNQQRLATAKSALLIYCALLGLSPILKSLTKSTTSDSIWAMSCWLMCINIAFFDYGGGVGVKFPASLSTNAAVMASTVLASRLTSTLHVFSLTLFSIEVFGLFPVFRRHLQHRSWRGHVVLTMALIMGASGSMGVTISRGGWKAATLGVILGSILTGLAMGGCSWWLIDLQKYKNEIRGPWDPARPVIRRRWD